MGITDAKIVNFFKVSTKKRKKVIFLEFERIVSQKRLRRYVNACGGDTRKALTLYRYNLRISREMFTMISCFEVAFRNAIDNELTARYGNEWLKDSVSTGGFLTGFDTVKSFGIVKHTYDKLVSEGQYSHTKLLSGLEFGVWKYMYSPPQFRATGRVLLRVFPYKQRSTPNLHINHTYIFNELDKINTLRNRIAHHEPICFLSGQDMVYTDYIKKEYQNIQTLFSWMGINGSSMLYGLDHVLGICRKIDLL